MREFTEKEKRLCKLIAEKKRKKIECGDYAVVEFPRLGEQVILIDSKWERQEKGIYNYSIDEVYPNYFPLWQENNCLDWLMERGFYIERLGQDDECLWSLEIHEFDDMGMVKGTKAIYGGESKLEPCLRAILAIKEENQ